MSQNKLSRELPIIVPILAFLVTALMSASLANSKPKTTKLTGHVLGFRLHPLKNMGDGPDGEYFVFIPDWTKAKIHEASPVLIAYSFFSNEPDLPDSFFDYSKHFQIKVSRNPDCDGTAVGVFYIKTTYTDKPEKPPGKDYFFHLSIGAPKMDFADDLALPCYEMHPGSYSLLKK